MKRTAILLLCLCFITLSGCKAKKMLDEAAVSKELADKGTTELLKEAAEDKYDAPQDGRLTDAQIQMYLKVREHEKKIAQVAKKELQQHAQKADKSGEKSLGGMVEGFKAMGSFADLVTADIRAAKELGFNTAEYTWVKERVLEASTAQMGQQAQKASAAMFDQAYAQTKKQYDEAQDEPTKKMLAEMLANYEKSKQEMNVAQNQDASVQYNLQLLSKYDNALNALATELSKYEDKEGDAQKGIEEWSKQLEKATKEAQQGAN